MHTSSPQDFETNEELKCKVIGFLEEVMHDPELLTQERKAAANIVRWGAALGRPLEPGPTLYPHTGGSPSQEGRQPGQEPGVPGGCAPPSTARLHCPAPAPCIRP